jgi:hypothetical protein
MCPFSMGMAGFNGVLNTRFSTDLDSLAQQCRYALPRPGQHGDAPAGGTPGTSPTKASC